MRPGEHCVASTGCKGAVYLPGHVAALGSNWCCVRKRGTGHRVPQDAALIPLILLGLILLNNCSHKIVVLHVALHNSCHSFKVIKNAKILSIQCI